MRWEFEPTAIPLLMAGAVSLALAIYCWRFRDKRIGRVFIALAMTVAIWNVGEFIQRGALTDSVRVLATNINFTVIPLSTVLIVVFALLYTNRGYLVNHRLFSILLGWAAFDTIVMWTNSWHGWMFTSITMDGFVRGPFFAVHIAVSYIFTVFVIILAVQLLIQLPGFNVQTLILLMGVTYPLVANLLYVLRIIEAEGDWTPFNFFVSLLLLSLSLYASGKLDIQLLARDQIVDSLEDLMVITDSVGAIVSINEAASRFLEVQNEFMVGVDFLGLLADSWESQLVYTDSESRQAELTLKRNEQQVYFDVRVSDVYDRARAFQGKVYLLRNITERKMAEQALYLERQLAEELAEKFRQARDEALDASRAKSELLARVSHELRTPLGAILGYTQTLSSGQSGDLTERQMSALKRIMANGDDLSRLIEEILNEAQLNTGRIQINMTHLRPSHIVEHVIGQMKPAADEKQLQLKLELNSNVPYEVLGDQLRVQQVLTNLVSNAIKYTDEGQVAVSVFAEGQSHWGFAVTDTGAGIPAEKQHEIFQPFVQIDGSHTRQHGGFGLGLSIVKKIVELLQGEIELESVPGQGSTFRVRFPLKPEIEELTIA